MSLLIISWSQSPLPDFSVFQDLNVFSCFSTETTDDHTYFLFLSSGLCCSRNDQNVWEANTVLRIPSLLVVDYTMFLISHQLRIRCCGLLSQMINLTSHFLPTYLSPSYFFASCSSFPYIPHLHHHQFPPRFHFSCASLKNTWPPIVKSPTTYLRPHALWSGPIRIQAEGADYAGSCQPSKVRPPRRQFNCFRLRLCHQAWQ